MNKQKQNNSKSNYLEFLSNKYNMKLSNDKPTSVSNSGKCNPNYHKENPSNTETSSNK